MKSRGIGLLLLDLLALSFIVPNAQLTLVSNEKAVLFESPSFNRILYLNDSWNDLPPDFRNPRYVSPSVAKAAEIRKIEVENNTIIVSANGIMPNSSNSLYILFFDIDLNGITDISWMYQKGSPKMLSLLYRFSDKAYYFNGSWHPNCYIMSAENFKGKIVENATTGETHFHLQGIVNGTVRIKLASMADFWVGTRRMLEGDFVPGTSFSNGTKMKLFGWPYANACDQIFPYSNDTVTFEVSEPPPPPPPPEKPPMNFFVQLAVWAVQATFWIKDAIVNLPFWFRDNAVTGSIAVSVLVMTSYSFIKKRRISKQRLKRQQNFSE